MIEAPLRFRIPRLSSSQPLGPPPGASNIAAGAVPDSAYSPAALSGSRTCLVDELPDYAATILGDGHHDGVRGWGRRALPNLGRPSVLALEAPVIVPRSGWGADESYRFSAGSEIWPRQLEHYVKVIVHHTVTSDGADDVAAVIQAIYYYHAVTLGWGDIGYNFLIDQAGTIYEGGREGGASLGPRFPAQRWRRRHSRDWDLCV